MCKKCYSQNLQKMLFTKCTCLQYPQQDETIKLTSSLDFAAGEFFCYVS